MAAQAANPTGVARLATIQEDVPLRFNPLTGKFDVVLTAHRAAHGAMAAANGSAAPVGLANRRVEHENAPPPLAAAGAAGQTTPHLVTEPVTAPKPTRAPASVGLVDRTDWICFFYCCS